MNGSENILCKLIGHNWTYKDYTEWMKPDGSRYSYKRSRRCSRCHKKEITFSDKEIEWRVFVNEI
ncbi:MAG: hypothetical protein ABI855_11385 [Bacteroidota bacterium]